MKKSKEPESPVSRINFAGVRSATAVDLLASALSDGAAESLNQETVANAILKRYGINQLGDLGKTDLMHLANICESDATRVLSAIELGRRAGLSGKGEPENIKNDDDVARYFRYLQDERKENFCTLLLNSKNGVIGVRTIHIGTVNMSVVGPREVFRDAIREGATTIIVVHNHPSGDPEPSEEDVVVTHRLVSVGEILDIPVVDHVIIGHGKHVSFAKRKIL